MKSTNEYITLLRQFKEQQSANYGVSEIGLFGSVARGEQRDGSDVDVFVVLTRPNLFIMSGIKQDLEKLFGCSVDLIRKHDRLSATFLANIEKEGIYA